MSKALFWDFDGTLVLSGPLWTNSVFSALDLNTENNPITFDEIRPHMQTGFPWHTPEQDFSHMTEELWWKHMFERFSNVYYKLGIEKSIANSISRKVKDIVLKVDNYKLYDDTISTLEKCLEFGYKNYIVSNNYPELEDIIGQLNLSKYFTDYIVLAKIGYDKPRKEIFKYALKICALQYILTGTHFVVGPKLTLFCLVELVHLLVHCLQASLPPYRVFSPLTLNFASTFPIGQVTYRSHLV